MSQPPQHLVTGANIWIDFEHTEVLDAVFGLPFVFVIPDLVLVELGDSLGVRVCRLGLRVEELTGEEVGQLIALAGLYPRPGRRDLAALVLAQRLGAVLLTGDASLRDAAGQEGIEVHGTLHLLDLVVAARLLSGPQAADAVDLMQNTGSRLPHAESRALQRRWRARL